MNNQQRAWLVAGLVLLGLSFLALMVWQGAARRNAAREQSEQVPKILSAAGGNISAARALFDESVNESEPQKALEKVRRAVSRTKAAQGQLRVAGDLGGSVGDHKLLLSALAKQAVEDTARYEGREAELEIEVEATRARAEEERKERANGGAPLRVVKALWSPGFPKRPGELRLPVWQVILKNQTDKPICNIRYATEYFDDSGNPLSRGGYFSGPNKGWVYDFTIKPGETRELPVTFEFPRATATRGSFEIVFWEHWDPKQKLFCEPH